MDSVIKVRRSFLNEIRGFCNFFASMCDTCYRVSCDCPINDAIHRAKTLIIMIDNVRDAEEERYFIDNPAEEYMTRILSAIRQGGGKPVRSQSISSSGGSRAKKARALKTLIKRKRIRKILIDNEPFYVINEDDIKQTTQTTINKQEG